MSIIRLGVFFRQQRFDIVQYSTPNAAFCAALAARLAGQPVRVYAQWGLRYTGFSGIPRIIFKMLEKLTCRCSSVIRPDSMENLEFALGEGLYSAQKAKVIGHGSSRGVDLTKFDIQKKQQWRQECRQRLHISQSEIVAGFVGSLRRDKGTTELLRAWQQLTQEKSGIRLLLVGDLRFSSSIDKVAWQWAESCGSITFVGHTTDVPPYLAAMDVFVFPSYREGMPSSVLEAQAMGLPVIGSDIPGIREIVCADQTGILVPVQDTSALVHAMSKLLADPALRQRLGNCACDSARNRFEQKALMRLLLDDRNELALLGREHRNIQDRDS